jgi:hypothetical protein
MYFSTIFKNNNKKGIQSGCFNDVMVLLDLIFLTTYDCFAICKPLMMIDASTIPKVIDPLGTISNPLAA